MYSTAKQDPSPLQLIEKAQTFSEDDDLLSPFDTGDVERQMKRAWWKTCSLFTFLLATVGIIVYVIIRDNNNNFNNAGPKNQLAASKVSKFTSKSTKSSIFGTLNNGRGELPSSESVVNIGERVKFRSLYSSEASQCVTSMMNVFEDQSGLTSQTSSITLANVESGFYHTLQSFATDDVKQELSTYVEYLSKPSTFGYYSKQLNVDFILNSLTVTAKSDAVIFLVSINWEKLFGNRLPYITQNVVTMQYDYETCTVSSLMPISFEECFNGDCTKTHIQDSNVAQYLEKLLQFKSEGNN